jgi:hypothetical protein
MRNSLGVVDPRGIFFSAIIRMNVLRSIVALQIFSLNVCLGEEKYLFRISIVPNFVRQAVLEGR